MESQAHRSNSPARSADSRAEALTALLRDAPAAGDADALRAHLRSLADAGVHSLFVHPGAKLPADLRSPAQVRAADDAERKLAIAEGRVGADKVRAPRGVHLATDDVALLEGYLDKHTTVHGPDVPPNVAVAVGPSRLVVVDADTAEQAAAFRADAGLPDDAEPTVRTPGAISPDGTVIHSDGGHWWFVVPDDVELPSGAGSLTDPDGGYAVMWDAHYALMPPSVRLEGPYVTTGAVGVLPGWLSEAIAARGNESAARAARVYDANSPTADRIAQWGASVSWAEILERLGWTAGPRPDSCGCPTFTAPGLHASPKSATGHEPGCTLFADSIDPPLHLWTDHDVEPFDQLYAGGEKKNITRLQAVAAGYYDHDEDAAMTDIDLHHDDVTTIDASLRGNATPPAAPDAGIGDGSADVVPIDPKLRDEIVKERRRVQAREIVRLEIAERDADAFELPPVRSLATLLAQDDPEVRFAVDQLIPAGGARIVLAAPEKAGKTTLMGNVVRSMADGDPFLDRFAVNTRASSIVVIDNEMSEGMTRRWLREQGIRNADAVTDIVTLRGEAGLFDVGNDRKRAMWARRLADLGCDFLIFDCLRPVLDALGLDENHEAGKFLTPFDTLLAEAGCETAMIVHHMGHSNERARGDSRIVGWPDCLWKIVRDPSDPDFGAKFFSAKVRDAEPVPEGSLSFDPATKHLTYAGGNRAQVTADQAAEKATLTLLRVVAAAKDPLGTESLIEAVGGNKTAARDALKAAIAAELISTTKKPGKGGGTLHHLTDAGREQVNAAPDPFDGGGERG